MEQRAVVPVEPAAQALAAFEQELADAAGYARAEKSAATRKAYWKDFEIFGLWCQDRGFAPLPAAPETVAAYPGVRGAPWHQAIDHRAALRRHPLRPQHRQPSDPHRRRAREGRGARHPAYPWHSATAHRAGHIRLRHRHGTTPGRIAHDTPQSRPLADGLRWRFPALRVGGPGCCRRRGSAGGSARQPFVAPRPTRKTAALSLPSSPVK